MKLKKVEFKYWHLAVFSGLISVVLYKLLQLFPNLIDEFLIAALVIIIVLILNPVRRFYRAFGALLTLFSSLLIIPAFDFTGVINIEEVGKVEKSLYEVIIKEPHWITYFVLGTLMIITLVLDYLERKKEETTESKQIDNENEYKLIYDMNEQENFEDWDFYWQPHLNEISVLDNSGGFNLVANHNGPVGVNKPLNFLKGKIEFDYLIKRTNKTQDNLLIYAIPMKNNRHNKHGYIEVGTDKQDHPENPFSPFRQKVLLLNDRNDNWKSSKIEFDFSNIPDAFYTVFAPRINEGCPRSGIGEFSIKNIKIYKFNSA